MNEASGKLEIMGKWHIALRHVIEVTTRMGFKLTLYISLMLCTQEVLLLLVIYMSTQDYYVGHHTNTTQNSLLNTTHT